MTFKENRLCSGEERHAGAEIGLPAGHSSSGSEGRLRGHSGQMQGSESIIICLVIILPFFVNGEAKLLRGTEGQKCWRLEGRSVILIT